MKKGNRRSWTPDCFGLLWVECTKDCGFDEECRLSFQENVSLPRVERAMARRRAIRG